MNESSRSWNLAQGWLQTPPASMRWVYQVQTTTTRNPRIQIIGDKHLRAGAGHLGAFVIPDCIFSRVTFIEANTESTIPREELDEQTVYIRVTPTLVETEHVHSLAGSLYLSPPTAPKRSHFATITFDSLACFGFDLNGSLPAAWAHWFPPDLCQSAGEWHGWDSGVKV